MLPEESRIKAMSAFAAQLGAELFCSGFETERKMNRFDTIHFMFKGKFTPIRNSMIIVLSQF